MRVLLTIGIILLTELCQGQNLLTQAGLQYGSWKDTVENIDPYGRVIRTGSYNIISTNTYPIIRKSNSNVFYEVKYLNGSAYIFYSKIANDSFAVQDGVWYRFDSLGKRIGSVLWKQGIMLNSRDYDSNGNLVYFDTTDYNSNSFTAYRCIDNRLFSKKQNPIGGNIPASEYYSNNKLIIDNAEPDFTSDFLKRPIDTNRIVLFAKDDIEITGIKDSSGNFKFLDTKMNLVSFPFKIAKNTTDTIYTLFKPSPSSLKSSEVFTLQTNESNKNEYPIYAKTYGHHLNYETVEIVTWFSLSISQDKFLVLPRMGTVTTTTITYPSGEVKYYDINELTKIDLSGLSPGDYIINTLACNVGGSQIMALRK